MCPFFAHFGPKAQNGTRAKRHARARAALRFPKFFQKARERSKKWKNAKVEHFETLSIWTCFKLDFFGNYIQGGSVKYTHSVFPHKNIPIFIDSQKNTYLETLHNPMEFGHVAELPITWAGGWIVRPRNVQFVKKKTRKKLHILEHSRMPPIPLCHMPSGGLTAPHRWSL